MQTQGSESSMAVDKMELSWLLQASKFRRPMWKNDNSSFSLTCGNRKYCRGATHWNCYWKKELGILVNSENLILSGWKYDKLHSGSWLYMSRVCKECREILPEAQAKLWSLFSCQVIFLPDCKAQPGTLNFMLGLSTNPCRDSFFKSNLQLTCQIFQRVRKSKTACVCTCGCRSMKHALICTNLSVLSRDTMDPPVQESLEVPVKNMMLHKS